VEHCQLVLFLQPTGYYFKLARSLQQAKFQTMMCFKPLPCLVVEFFVLIWPPSMKNLYPFPLSPDFRAQSKGSVLQTHHLLL
jgi:hypothetical protein